MLRMVFALYTNGMRMVKSMDHLMSRRSSNGRPNCHQHLLLEDLKQENQLAFVRTVLIPSAEIDIIVSELQ